MDDTRDIRTISTARSSMIFSHSPLQVSPSSQHTYTSFCVPTNTDHPSSSNFFFLFLSCCAYRAMETSSHMNVLLLDCTTVCDKKKPSSSIQINKTNDLLIQALIRHFSTQSCLGRRGEGLKEELDSQRVTDSVKVSSLSHPLIFDR
jgi:hypothetical protein